MDDSSGHFQTPSAKKRKCVEVIVIDSSPDSAASKSPAPLRQISPSPQSTAAPPGTSPTISNPYKKINAKQTKAKKKPRGNPIQRPGVETVATTTDDVLGKHVPSLERFCTALLRSTPLDYARSSSDSLKARELWTTICRRVQLTPPTCATPSTYPTPEAYQAPRAALVLEETRHALATAAVQQNGRESFAIRILYSESTSVQGNSRLSCVGLKKFGADQLKELRPGSILCAQGDDRREWWGVVWAGNRDTLQKKSRFTMICCTNVPDDSVWLVRPLGNIVTNHRCFWAMTTSISVPFFRTILQGDEEEGDDSKPSGSAGGVSSHDGAGAVTVEPPPTLILPPLNPSQKEAAESFLSSPSGRVTFVVGPPGTGKTSLLVSIIGRYLCEQTPGHSRLLVCAPTNKAISVVTTRFWRLAKSSNVRVLLIGDADKLLAEKGLMWESPLAPIFLYTWLPVVIKEYEGLLKDPDRNVAERLYKSLKDRLPGLPNGILESAAKVPWYIDHGYWLEGRLKHLLSELKSLPADQVHKDLMKSAQVLFCTLSSAGNTAFLSTVNVHDLVVDEAAAATEPEIAIPFHLNPKRLCLVGDSKQLPATVLSQTASDLGLSVSLHERLLPLVQITPALLNVQYRMDPRIAQFPSSRFYAGAIFDGPNVKRYARLARLLSGSPYICLQVNGMEQQGKGGSYRNELEANTVADLVSRLKRPGNDWSSVDKIRIITFYQAQVVLINARLQKRGIRHVTVATVDSSQGCEADVVILSLVRSPSDSKTTLTQHDAGFLTDDRRMNVALTRARHQLICVGNISALQNMRGAQTLQLLADDAQERGSIQNVARERRPPCRQLDLFYGT